jgi:hypothetical protein
MFQFRGPIPASTATSDASSSDDGCLALGVVKRALLAVAECNCSICRRTAELWHHCALDTVIVIGKGAAY